MTSEFRKGYATAVMLNLLYSCRRPANFFLLYFFLFPLLAGAAETAPALTVGNEPAYLYSGSDDRSEKIATLEPGEALVPLAEAVKDASWFLVQTQKGVAGWVKSTDVKKSDQLENLFKEIGSSTWSAVTSAGRAFGGTWTGKIDPASGEAGGTWTLIDGAGKTVSNGTWSARKSADGWRGEWRGVADGRKGALAGSWSADLRLPKNSGLKELFEAALNEAVAGEWKAGNQSGRWSIRAAK